ncbi:MAG: hypothetical protein NT030_07375 [Candidatus Saganbacteria bacterium]|nr:hypothetical protein [Candidatus Saganbacteria bacterium]
MNRLRFDTKVSFGKMANNRALLARYDEIYKSDRPAILANRLKPEQWLGTCNPGVSILIMPEQFSAEVSGKVSHIQQLLSEYEPNIALAPVETWHIGGFILNPSYNHDMEATSSGGKTVYAGPAVLQINSLSQYNQVINEVAGGFDFFRVHFQGVSASTNAIFLQGFDDGKLNQLREMLFEALDKAGLPFADRHPNIVHTTIARFTGELTDPENFIRKLDGLRDVEIGNLIIDKLVMIREKIAYLANYERLAEYRLKI